MNQKYFATCARRLEPILAGELRELGAAEVVEGRGGVQFSGDLAMLYRGPYSTRFYRKLHGVVHKEFRLRRAAGTVAPG